MPLCKKETFFVRLIMGSLIYTSVYADISIGILSSIENNAKVYLLYRNNSVACEPFGILPLEKMAASAVNTEECSTKIDELYRSSPHDKVFAKEHLKIFQSYHFERLKEGCVLYANGLETYSEMLLSRGLAVIDPKFDNPEWNAKLSRAQKGAETQMLGLHAGEIKKFCIKEEK